MHRPARHLQDPLQGSLTDEVEMRPRSPRGHQRTRKPTKRKRKDRGRNENSFSGNANSTSVNPLLGTQLQDGGGKGKDLSAGVGDAISVTVAEVPSSIVMADSGPNREVNPPEKAVPASRLGYPGSAHGDRRGASGSTSSRCGALRTVWCKWRAHFLLLLAVNAALCVLFLVMDGATLAKLRSQRRASALAMDVATAALQTANYCSEARAEDPSAAISPPDELLSLRNVLARRESKRKHKQAGSGTYVSYIDSAVSSLADASCEGATAHLSELFATISMETHQSSAGSNTVSMSENSMNTFSHAWGIAAGQLRSEGLLRVSEDPPISSLRVLDGLSHNYRCENYIVNNYALLTLPSLSEVLYCDNATREQLLDNLPVLQPPQIDIQDAFPLFRFLTTAWAERVPGLSSDLHSAHYVIHFSLHAAIIVFAVLGIFILVYVSIERRKEELTDAIVRRDFRLVPQQQRGDVAVAMTQRALRLLDFYCWRLGNLDLSADLLQGGDDDDEEQEEDAEEQQQGRLLAPPREGADDAAARLKDPNRSSPAKDSFLGDSQKKTAGVIIEGQRVSYPGSAVSSPLELANRDPFSSQELKGYHSTKDAALGGGGDMRLSFHAAQKPGFDKEIVGLRTRLHRLSLSSQLTGCFDSGDVLGLEGDGACDIDFNTLLLSQSRLRTSLLQEYATEYASHSDATQIQLYLQQLVHPMLLLRPFVPSYMARRLHLTKEESQKLGPSVIRCGYGSGVVMREGLEDDCLLAAEHNKSGNTDSSTESPPTSAAAAGGSGGVRHHSGGAGTTYLFVSFRSFNTSEALQKAEQHYKGTQESQRSGWFGGHRGKDRGVDKDEPTEEPQPEEAAAVEGGRAETATDVAVTMVDDDLGDPDYSPYRAGSRYNLRRGNKDGGTDPNTGDGDGGRPAKKRKTKAVGGRLTNAAVVRPGSASSVNPLSTGADVDGGGRDEANPASSYPLSVIAAGVNFMLHNIHSASEIFHGEVVQTSSDGVLVQFRPLIMVLAQQSHCFILDTESAKETIGTASRLDMKAHRKRRCAQLASFMSTEERAARTALTIESRIRRYLETTNNCLVPPDLLQCAQFVLSDASCETWRQGCSGSVDGGANSAGRTSDSTESGAATHSHGRPGGGAEGSGLGFYPPPDAAVAGDLRGLVEFHVSKHYCVLSRCMPMIFSLEQVAMRRDSRPILITRAVHEKICKMAITYPVHYLDIPNLTLYSFRQRLSQSTSSGSSSGSRDGKKGGGGRGSRSASKSRSFSAVPQGGSGAAPEANAASDATGSNADGGLRLDNTFSATRPRASLPFSASETIYELQSITPLSHASMAYHTYITQRDRTQARREHWHLIWARYEDILRSRTSLRALQPYLDGLFSRSAAQQRGPDGGTREGTAGRDAGVSPAHDYLTRNKNATAASGGGGGGGGGGLKGAEVVILLSNEKDSKRERSVVSKSPDAATPTATEADATTPPAPVCDARDTSSSNVRHRGGNSTNLLSSRTSFGSGPNGLVSLASHRELVSMDSSNAELSAADCGSATGSTTGNTTSNSYNGSSSGASASIGGGQRSYDYTQTTLMMTKLTECLAELRSYKHIYGNLTKSEEYAFIKVVDDVVGMMLALGVSDTDIEW